MTLISHSSKFIFIHIYKTAGTTITNSLISNSSLKDRLVYEFSLTHKLSNLVDYIFNSWDDGKKWLTGYHKHATAREIKEHLGERRFNNYYKFAFVRNSWDWMVSLYFYVRREASHRDHHIANQLSFKQYLKYYLEKQPQLQIDFLVDHKGEIIVDKIGNFENLAVDFEEIIKQLKIDDSEKEKISLGIKNKSANRQKDYKIYYDRESQELVANYFKTDIEKFKFKFE